MKVALLAGGTGGAKLAAGMQDMLGGDLTVIANTGDDIEINGLHVSPDPDLITYWLNGEIDSDQGWGIREDTNHVYDRLAVLGAPAWFPLGDLDLASCLYRKHFIEEGGRLTTAQQQIGRALGVSASVLPMCDEAVRTRVLSLGEWRSLQEYLILGRGEPPVETIELQGIENATVTVEVSEALRGADLVVIGPSNPVISIGPILSVPGLRQAIQGSGAPVIAVSPLVGGKVIKGPTARFMDAVGRPTTAAGVASLYEGLIGGMLVDEDDPDPPPGGIATELAATLMDSRESRVRVARAALKFGVALGAPAA